VAVTHAPERLSFRSLTARDRDFVLALSAEAFSEYTPGAGPRTLEMTGARGAASFVAELGARAVGFAVVTCGSSRANLDAIAVSAEVRGKGIGRALLQHAERVAERAGFSEIALVTADSNLAALDLFLAQGYSLVARLPRFYARGQNALRLAKRLPR
jgi:ribosomal-protein-alanine N-acetyltransferase